jgi:hypothetical protein
MKKFQRFFNISIPIALGLVTFFAVTGGYILIPANIAWLGGGFDPSTHYFGWAFYRFGSWTIPIGLNPNFGIDFSNSIVFSDSIPIFAIIFKALELLTPLGDSFQYLGLWTLVCFILQYFMAWQLIGIFSANLYQKLFGSLLIAFSPPMMARIGVHTALVAHFLILMALYLHFSKPSKLRIFQWLGIIGVASLAHFYLLSMVLLLWAADLIDRKLRKQSLTLQSFLIEIALVFLGVYFLMWQAGYFSIGVSSASASGYGFYRMNLLSLFDSRGWSYLLKTIPMPMDFGDGFNYLGLGALWLMAFAFYAVVKKKISLTLIFRSHYALLALCIFLSIFSITNNIGLGNKGLLIPLPEWMIGLASNLRGSGRMFWPVYYCLQLFVIYVVVKVFTGKRLIWILAIAAFLQIVDTSAGWLNIRNKLSSSIGSEIDSPLKSQFWKDAAGNYNKVIRVPGKNIANQWEIFADYAAKNHQATNFTFLARIDQEKLNYSNKLLMDSIVQGSFDRDSLYIFESWKINPLEARFNPSRDLLGYADGYVFLAPDWQSKSNFKGYEDVRIIQKIAPEIAIGSAIDFSKNGLGRELFLLDGWGYSEDWGTWSDGSSASIRLPTSFLKSPKSMEMDVRAFVASGHQTQNIEILINGILAQKAQLTTFESNSLSIPLPQDIHKSKFITVEIKLKNPALAQEFGGAPGDTRVLGVGLKSIIFR